MPDSPCADRERGFRPFPASAQEAGDSGRMSRDPFVSGSNRGRIAGKWAILPMPGPRRARRLACTEAAPPAAPAFHARTHPPSGALRFPERPLHRWSPPWLPPSTPRPPPRDPAGASWRLALQEAFTAAVRLRNRRQRVADADTFRGQIKHLLALANRDAVAAGYDPRAVKLAVYAYVAFLDESVLGSGEPGLASWPRQSLQEEVFGDHMAGETFFAHLDELLARQDSDEAADVLEVFLLCLLLGFRGRYAASDRGALDAHVRAVREKVTPHPRRARAALPPVEPPRGRDGARRRRPVGGAPVRAWRPASPPWPCSSSSSTRSPWGRGSARSARWRPAPRAEPRRAPRPSPQPRVPSMKQPKAWLAAAGAMVLFALLAWASGPLLGLKGRDVWILRGGLLLLGVAAAVLAGMYTAARARRAPVPEAEEGDDVGEALQAAQARLAAAELAGSSRISALPVVLVMGPSGSAKTSAVVHSGVDPELLAGEVERAGAVLPTGLLNVWYGRETVFLEAGGALLDDEGRWQRLVRHLQPGRLAAVMGQGAQAPRAAVVCFACDELLRPGGADAVAGAARKLRGRLADLSRQLGVRLPVYVLFTRADRIPHFADYVRGLTQEEAQEVLGATFPMADPPAAGLYPEFAARRAGDALRTLHPLALRGPDAPASPRAGRGGARARLRASPRDPQAVGAGHAVPDGAVPPQPAAREPVPARLLLHRRAHRPHRGRRRGRGRRASGEPAGGAGGHRRLRPAPRARSRGRPGARRHPRGAGVGVRPARLQRRHPPRPRGHGGHRRGHQGERPAPHAGRGRHRRLPSAGHRLHRLVPQQPGDALRRPARGARRPRRSGGPRGAGLGRGAAAAGRPARQRPPHRRVRARRAAAAAALGAVHRLARVPFAAPRVLRELRPPAVDADPLHPAGRAARAFPRRPRGPASTAPPTTT